MKVTFDLAFDRLMGVEGGYTAGNGDPGGETNWGISKRSYPNVDIKGLTREGAKAIYLRDFWDRLGASQLPDSVVFQLFDFAVNSGIETAVRAYQRAIGVADDGHFGPVSVAAAAVISEQHQLVLILAERLDYMRRLANWPTAGKGWAGRIATDLRYAAQDA